MVNAELIVLRDLAMLRRPPNGYSLTFASGHPMLSSKAASGPRGVTVANDPGWTPSV
jgi:hypothetical protein